LAGKTHVATKSTNLGGSTHERRGEHGRREHPKRKGGPLGYVRPLVSTPPYGGTIKQINTHTKNGGRLHKKRHRG